MNQPPLVTQYGQRVTPIANKIPHTIQNDNAKTEIYRLTDFLRYYKRYRKLTAGLCCYGGQGKSAWMNRAQLFKNNILKYCNGIDIESEYQGCIRKEVQDLIQPLDLVVKINSSRRNSDFDMLKRDGSQMRSSLKDLEERLSQKKISYGDSSVDLVRPDRRPLLEVAKLLWNYVQQKLQLKEKCQDHDLTLTAGECAIRIGGNFTKRQQNKDHPMFDTQNITYEWFNDSAKLCFCIQDPEIQNYLFINNQSLEKIKTSLILDSLTERIQLWISMETEEKLYLTQTMDPDQTLTQCYLKELGFNLSMVKSEKSKDFLCEYQAQMSTTLYSAIKEYAQNVDRFVGKEIVIDSKNGYALDHDDDIERGLKKYYKTLKRELRGAAKRLKLKKSNLDHFIGLNKHPKAKAEIIQVQENKIKSPKGEKNGNYDHKSKSFGHLSKNLNLKHQDDLKKQKLANKEAINNKGRSRKTRGSRKNKPGIIMTTSKAMTSRSFVEEENHIWEGESLQIFAEDDSFITEKEASEIVDSDFGGPRFAEPQGKNLIDQARKSRPGEWAPEDFQVGAGDWRNSFKSFGAN